jgi:membrane-associated phospholipid phosphatase
MNRSQSHHPLRRRTLRSLAPLSASLLFALPAHAQEPEPSTSPLAPLAPRRVVEAPPGRTTFDVDPVVDGAIVSVTFGFAGILDLVNSTGEIRPQQISPTFNEHDLLGIDRNAVSQTIDPNASNYSNYGLAAAVVFAMVDPVLSGFREKDVQSGIADAFIYAESTSVAYALTNITKMAVRRPRPKAYMAARASQDPNYSNSDTDSSLSFFSGHAALVSAIGGTATYLAFARSPHTARPWFTLAASTALTGFVSYERVRAGAHFPTDVIAASIAGVGVGVIVPHLHRSGSIEQRRIWVGFAPVDRGEGGSLELGGSF